jgi:hypothetical protein
MTLDIFTEKFVLTAATAAINFSPSRRPLRRPLRRSLRRSLRRPLWRSGAVRLC